MELVLLDSNTQILLTIESIRDPQFNQKKKNINLNNDHVFKIKKFS